MLKNFHWKIYYLLWDWGFPVSAFGGRGFNFEFNEWISKFEKPQAIELIEQLKLATSKQEAELFLKPYHNSPTFEEALKTIKNQYIKN